MRITDVNIDSRPRNRNPVTENEDKVTLVVPNSIDETRRLEVDGEEAKPSTVQQVTNDQYGEPLSAEYGDIEDQPDFDESDGMTEPEESEEEDTIVDEAPEPVEDEAPEPVEEDVIEDNAPVTDDKDGNESETDMPPSDAEDTAVDEPALEESDGQTEEPTDQETDSPPEPVNRPRQYDNSIVGRIRDSATIISTMWSVAYKQASEITEDKRRERMEKRRARRQEMSEKAEQRRKSHKEAQERRQQDAPEKPPKKKGIGIGIFPFGNGRNARRTDKKGGDGQDNPSDPKRPLKGMGKSAKQLVNPMTAKERAMMRKREKYDLILSGQLVDPDASKYKPIWRNMVKDGYVEYRRMEYVIGIDRYRIDCSIIKHEDLPLGQHHVTGAKYTYAYDVNGVSFSSTKNNNFTAVSQYNYMHNRVFDDAMSYKWYNQKGGKKSNFLFYVIGVIVFGVGFGLYFVFMH